jgi:hypothetical protein
MKKVNLFVILLLIVLTGCSTPTETKSDRKVENKSDNINWEVRHKYFGKDKELFNVFPDPALEAGKPFGYIFSLTEPFEIYEGKELSINAYHKETGERIVAYPPEKVTEPSSGYSSLNRFTTFFELPHSGLWRLEVVLNGKKYGDVIINVKE